MILLGLDCAGTACSAAILGDGELRSFRQEIMNRGQAERIVPMIRTCLEEAGCTAADLDGVAVTVGPGAFTGVRIGIAAAQGIARTAECPVIGVTVTAALAQAVPPRPDVQLCAAIDSRRADPFCEVFRAQDTQWLGNGPEILSGGFAALAERPLGPDKEMLFVGNKADEAREALGSGTVLSAVVHPDPGDIARLGLAALGAGQIHPPVPLYLRAPDVSAPSRDKARRPNRA